MNKKKFQCKKCNKLLHSKQALHNHLIIHIDEADRPKLSCPDCNKFFYQRKNLSLHHKSAHPGKVLDLKSIPMFEIIL